MACDDLVNSAPNANHSSSALLPGKHEGMVNDSSWKPSQGSRGRGMKRGGGRASIGNRKRPAKAVPAGANLVGKRILVLQTPSGSDPEWHIGTIEEWLGVRSVPNLEPHTLPTPGTS